MAARSKNLKRENMNLPTKILFTLLFFLMGLSIFGAGLGGQEATASIIMSIGLLMVLIGLAPWYIPLLIKNYVTKKVEANPEIALK